MKISPYVPRQIEKCSLLSGLTSVYSFLWRTIKQRTYRIITFLLSYPAENAKAYCRYWEIEHRIDTACKRILKDVGEDVKPFYKNLKAKVNHAKNLRCPKFFFSQLENFEKMYSLEKNIIEEFGTQLIKAKKKTLEQKIILQKKHLNEVDQLFLSISKLHKNNPPIDHLIALRQFGELNERWNQKFDEMINRMSTFTHPKQVCELSIELIQFIELEQNILTSLDKGDPYYVEQTELCDQLKAETLKKYVQECVGACLEENGKVTLENLKKPFTIFPCFELSKFIHENEHFFRRQVESLLMNHLIKMKNFDVWEECCRSLLSRYRNSQLLSQMEFFWKLRKKPVYIEQIFNYVVEKGFTDYVKFLQEKDVLPGKIELIALARQNKQSIRLYSHYFEYSYEDLGGPSKKIPDFFFLEDQNGLLHRIVPN